MSKTVNIAQRILLVEDDSDLVAVLTDALVDEGYEVESEAVGERAIAIAGSGAFDLILLDVVLTGASGFDVCRTLRAQGVGIPILMLSARSDVTDKIRALQLGADDYVTKPFDPGELLARVRALLRRARTASVAGPAYCRCGDVSVDFLRGTATRRGAPMNLSAKELQLLRYLTGRPRAAVSREELLAEVWGYSSTITRTVDVHIATLRQKLEENPRRPRYILTVRGQGYMFLPAPVVTTRANEHGSRVKETRSIEER